MAAGLPGTGMTEKPESDEFEDEEADEPVTEEGDVDLDQVISDYLKRNNEQGKQSKGRHKRHM